jgi:epoxyqueuosine reductase
LSDVTSEQLIGALARRGWRVAVLPVERLADLRAEIDARRAALDPAVRVVVERNLDLGALAEGARSLVAVVVPHACARATVTCDGRARDVPIPTTYCRHAEIPRAVVDAVAAALAPADGWAMRVGLPEKLAAVCAGLARYGRNNIAYAEGCGSFCELAVCATDLAPGTDPWTGPRLLARCETCEACRRACPSGAIGADRFLLHGDRCLTLHNESDGPFPAWIDPAWHHCLWGCLRCQRCCPENLAVRDEVAETAVFDERETALLLAGVDRDLLAAEPGLRDKLGELGLLAYDDDFLGVALARNLAAVLATD